MGREHVCHRRSRRGRCGSPRRRRTTPTSLPPTRGLPDPAELANCRGQRRAGRGPPGQRPRPRPDRRPDSAPRAETWMHPNTAPGTVQLEVDVPPDEDAVVLLERDGVFSWHLPVDTGFAARSLEPGPQTRRFEIDVQPGPASAATDAARPSRPRAARHRRRGRRARTRLQLRRARADGEGRREDGGARQDGPGPPDRSRRVELEALRDPRRAAPADRPTRARAAVHPRHLLLDRRRLRRAGCGRERPGLPAHGDRGVRRRHRLRPQDPQRRPEAERARTCWSGCRRTCPTPSSSSTSSRTAVAD